MSNSCPYCLPASVWGATPQLMQELLEKHQKNHTVVSGLVSSEPYATPKPVESAPVPKESEPAEHKLRLELAEALTKLLDYKVDPNSQPINLTLQILATHTAAREQAARIRLVEDLLQATKEVTDPQAYVTDTGVAQSIRVHTNSLLEHKLLALRQQLDSEV